jgi:hypothetical protein
MTNSPDTPREGDRVRPPEEFVEDVAGAEHADAWVVDDLLRRTAGGALDD